VIEQIVVIIGAYHFR